MFHHVRGRIALLIAACLLLVAAAAGCGEDEAASGGEGSAQQEQKLEKKTIGVLASAGQAEIQQRIVKGIREGAETLGWDVQYVDGLGDPAKMSQGLQGMVNQRVDAIVGVFLEPPAVEPALRAAKDANIPVVNTGFVGTPSKLVQAEFVANETLNSDALSERMAEDLEDGANVGLINLPQFFGVGQRVEAFQSVAKQAGLNVVAEHDVDLLNLFDDTTKAGRDMLSANPDLDAFFSCCDFAGMALAPAIEQARSDAMTYSFYAIPSVLPLIRQGKLVVVENDNGKTGLMALDQLAAHFANGSDISAEEALNDDPIKRKIVDKSNVPPEGQEVFPLEDDLARYRDKWREQYGVGT